MHTGPREGRGAPRTTVADHIYQTLREAIVRGDYAEGTELKQVELARQFGVSRIPVREALQRLQAERLLTAEPFHRHVVRTLGPEELDELMAIRMALECMALRRFAHRLDAGTIGRLREVNGQLRTQTDSQKWLQGDWELHRLLAGGDTATAEFAADVRRRINRYLNAAASLGERHVAAVADHAAIIDALEEGDIDSAEARLRDHIRGTAAALGEVLERRQTE